jgi:hypothetical protein
MKDVAIGLAAILPALFRVAIGARGSAHRPEPPVLDLAPLLLPPPEEPCQDPKIVAPKVINAHEMILRLATWMREWGFVGWMPFEDLDECYALFCADENLEPLPVEKVRELFKAAPGVRCRRMRLIHVKDKQLIRIRKRMKRDRIVLYHVLSLEQMRERTRARNAKARRKAAKNAPAAAPVAPELSNVEPLKRAA